MAVNLADMQTVGVIVGSPIVAGAAAVHWHVGWFIPAFILGGLLAGIALGYLTHFVAYRLVRTRSSFSAVKEWMAAAAYLLGPLIFGIGGLAFVTWASDRLAGMIH